MGKIVFSGNLAKILVMVALTLAGLYYLQPSMNSVQIEKTINSNTLREESSEIITPREETTTQSTTTKQKEEAVTVTQVLNHQLLGNFTFQTLDGDFWLLNGNVLQLGTVMSLREDNQTEIEAMISSIGINLGAIINFIKFIIKLNKETVIVKNVTLTFVASCLLTNEESLKIVDNKVTVALIDIREYESKKNGSRIFGRTPEFFNRHVPKEKAVLICACSVRDIKDHVYEHIVTWARINKLFGVRRVQVYSVDNKSPGYHRLKNNHSDLLDIFGYVQNAIELCELHNMTNFTSCVEKYGGFFFRGGVNFHHEDLLMKYCYIRAKYKYQYVSNLDHDELIMPRRFSIYHHETIARNLSNKTSCEDVYKNQTNANSNIYEYFANLQKQYGKRVSTFRFNNFIYMTQTNQIFEDIFRNPTSTNYTFKDMRLRSPINSKNDMIYFNSLKMIKNLTDCLDRKYLDQKLAGPNRKYANVMAKFMKFNSKCVFNTDFVDSIKAHNPDSVKANTNEVTIPVEQGVLNHYRDHDYGYAGGEGNFFPAESIRDWIVDLEFFSFLVKHFNFS
jgi:hypothetical protein